MQGYILLRINIARFTQKLANNNILYVKYPPLATFICNKIGDSLVFIKFYYYFCTITTRNNFMCANLYIIINLILVVLRR